MRKRTCLGCRRGCHRWKRCGANRHCPSRHANVSRPFEGRRPFVRFEQCPIATTGRTDHVLLPCHARSFDTSKHQLSSDSEHFGFIVHTLNNVDRSHPCPTPVTGLYGPDIAHNRVNDFVCLVQAAHIRQARAVAMFILARVADTVQVPPMNLGLNTDEAVLEELRKKYVDRVVRGSGLCVAIYDLHRIQGGEIFPGDGAVHFNVEFRVVFFRPLVGEVLEGKLVASDERGLQVSLGFFHDIHIPERFLQDPSVFNQEEKVWVWKFGENDMFMDVGEEIRFRVLSVKFPDPTTNVVQKQPDGTQLVQLIEPMQVIGDVNRDGLGLLAWWTQDEEQEEEL